MDRREMLKVSLLTGGAALLSGEVDRAAAAPIEHPTGGLFEPSSPEVMNPFTVELRRMPVKTPLPGGAADLALPANGGVAPNGTVYPQVVGNDALTPYTNSLERIVAPQQRNSANNVQFPPKKFYFLDVRQFHHVFHPDPPYNKGSLVWGYDGRHPGPTFMSRYGEPILVRIHNGLYGDTAANPPDGQIPGGFGDPRISTHLHNGHSGSESDGNPADIYPPVQAPKHLPQYPDSILAIRFRDHHYAMFRAGLEPRPLQPGDPPFPNKNDGHPTESVCTLWYHDHSMDRTAENVYKGLVGFHLFFDEFDSGNETDPDPRALRLPSGEFDVPLVIQDKRFDANGQLVLAPAAAQNDTDARISFGVLGDRFTGGVL